ncbi:MAG: regulatory protein RecX [Mariprofundaceae bacterium]|nr:regulatory protein RecX [Mariprofundaceae bacterium]
MSIKLDVIKAEQQEAYASAVRMLGLREHNELELRDKLTAKKYDEIVIDHVIELLKHYDYLSEDRYAAAFLRARLKCGETPWLAAQKAKRKGGEIAAVQAAQDEAEDSFDAWQTCKALLDKRDPMALRNKDKRIWQRQVRFLQNKGFALSTILQVMNDEEQ